MTETIIAVLPPAGVIPKKPWTRESRKNLGPIGICKTVQTFTHQGTSDSKDKIGIETKMTYQSPAAGNKADLSFVIREGNLTGEATGGLAIFDRALGRFESVRMSMKLSGQLKIEIGGTVSDVSLTQTQETSSVTSSKNPWLRP
ncbi:MAG: hypothetical protein FJ303_15890 [Planctomycetes bacterium]|nr:hypothetical protein [Planctomycetota bacterium]